MPTKSDKLSLEELNILLNCYPEDTVGNVEENTAIIKLDKLGKEIGYGRLMQLATYLCRAQLYQDREHAADLKRGHFQSNGWDLPDRFEEVANGS